MKKTFYIILLVIYFFCFNCNSEKYEINKIKRRLKKLDSIGSSVVGFGASEHEFYVCYKKLIKIAKYEDFLNFLQNKNIIVKAMGIYCIANSVNEKEAYKILKKFVDDKTEITFYRYGCIGEKITLGDFTVQSIVIKNFLNKDEL